MEGTAPDKSTTPAGDEAPPGHPGNHTGPNPSELGTLNAGQGTAEGGHSLDAGQEATENAPAGPKADTGQDSAGEAGSSGGSVPAGAVVRRAGALVGRHRWFAGVLALGVVLRVVAMLGFRPVLWFPDSYTYIVTVFRPRPDLVRPAGYSMFLKLLEPFHSFALVAAVQHLMGLAVGVMVYAAARRTRMWVRTLAAAPVLLDAYQVELEHLLVSDTLFMFLVAGAVVAAIRREVSWRLAAGVGLLLAAATLTRTIGQPLVVLVACWFLLRRRIAVTGVMLVAALVPVMAYMGWFYATYDRMGLVGANGVFLYARTQAFADCRRMDPPPDLRVLCDPRAPEDRPPSQEYIWSPDSPLVRLPGITFSRENDDLAGRFAMLAIRSQPLDYAGSIVSELARTFTWGRPVYPDQEIYDYYEFPEGQPGPPGRHAAQLGAQLAEDRYERAPVGTRVVEPFAGWMRIYQDVVRLPGTILLIVLLAPPALAVIRRRSEMGWLLPWSTTWALLVVPAAVAEFDYRYVLPAVPLACLAAALATRPDQVKS
ncbi:hypothetical protein [Nonomuraea typhae]|uniref:hypothetical protein n=1 Tax=Nonomuraea typhae TaxID=2603600 RepID=UPI001FEB4EB6|nr:hypothetical protein [Nonomuraea typhae]